MTTPNRSRWIPNEDPPSPKRAALHRMGAALRESIESLMSIDPSQEEAEAAAEEAERLAASLAKLPRGRTLYGYAEIATSGNPRDHFDHSPVVGMANPIAPPLKFALVDGKVVGTGRFGTAYEGPPGHVHGGWIAAALDDLLGMAQAESEHHGMTGTLTIRYRKPTPLHRELRFEASLDRVEGRKLFARGAVYDGDTLCAEAEAIFITVNFEHLARLALERETDA